MTTKAQEQAALDQIRTILATLEPGSYVRTAFEGCSELAQDNIDNDWGTSMKELRDTADQRAEERAMAKVAERMKRLETAVFSLDDMHVIASFTFKRMEHLKRECEKAKDKLALHSDAPDKAPFLNARAEYRWASHELDTAQNLSERIDEVMEAATQINA